MSVAHKIALERFAVQPKKCFQRHMREVHAESVQREQLTSLLGVKVEAISRAEAEKIILEYEWLRSIGTAASAFYGLKLNGDLLGCVVFGVGSSPEARAICGEEHVDSAVCLQRGACVPWAPKNSASFLIRHACRVAHKELGWKIFFAYSDPEAGEIGTVYQAAGWEYIGRGLGRRASVHLNWVSSEGTVLSSNSVHKTGKTKREMFATGYRPRPALAKHKYVWFETQELREQCRYPFLSYPKRSTASDKPKHGEQVLLT